MEIGLIILALALGLLCYAQLLHSLNLKSIEWQTHMSDGYKQGLYTAEQVRQALAHPPWYVRLMKRVDVFAKLPAVSREENND